MIYNIFFLNNNAGYIIRHMIQMLLVRWHQMHESARVRSMIASVDVQSQYIKTPGYVTLPSLGNKPGPVINNLRPACLQRARR